MAFEWQIEIKNFSKCLRKSEISNFPFGKRKIGDFVSSKKFGIFPCPVISPAIMDVSFRNNFRSGITVQCLLIALAEKPNPY